MIPDTKKWVKIYSALPLLCACEAAPPIDRQTPQPVAPTSETATPAPPTPASEELVSDNVPAPASPTPSPTPADGIPTDEQVQAAYREAAQAFAWFELESLDATGRDTFTQDGRTYYRVTERFASYHEFLDFLRGLFCEELVQNLLTSTNYLDTDGLLYTLGCSGGGSVAVRNVRIHSITQESDARIKVTVYSDILTDDYLSVDHIRADVFDYVKLDGKWVFQDFYLITASSGEGHGDVVSAD